MGGTQEYEWNATQYTGLPDMIFRQKIAALLAFAGSFLLFGAPAPLTAEAEQPATQVAAAPVHSVTINVNVNGGDKVAAKEVQLTIEPAPGNNNKEARATLKGPGKVNLPEGKYTLIAFVQEIRVVDKLEVGGPTTHTISLVGGYATLKWINQIGGKAIKDNVEWRILTYRKVNGQRSLITKLNGSQPRVMLPEGWYIAEATYKGEVKRLAIEIANARQFDYVLCASC